jgi:hypothetical protein
MTLIFKCGNCKHQGPRAGNGFSWWCGGCGINNQLKLVEDTELTRRRVNGNVHLVNMEVLEYDGLKFVTESPRDGAVRLTIYRGEETTPMSTELYGNENS